MSLTRASSRCVHRPQSSFWKGPACVPGALCHPKAAPALIHSVFDDAARLDLVDVRGKVQAALVGPGALPLAIEPHDPDGPIVGEQLGDLVLEVLVVTVDVGPLGR